MLRRNNGTYHSISIGTGAEQAAAGVKPEDGPYVAKAKTDFHRGLTTPRKMQQRYYPVTTWGTKGGWLGVVFVLGLLGYFVPTALGVVVAISCLVIGIKIVGAVLDAGVDLAILIPAAAWRFLLHAVCYVGVALLIGGLLYSSWR